MEKIIDLIDKFISPNKTWFNFLQKIFSTLLIASISAYAYHTYQSGFVRSPWDELPLHDAIEGDRKHEVAKYLNRLIEADPELISVWVYSWPDARTLIPVVSAGSNKDPIPLGYFRRTDTLLVGELVMEQCDCLKRPNKKLLACPIVAENDTWGVIVFEHKVDNERPKKYKSIYIALAHKVAHIIYHNED